MSMLSTENCNNDSRDQIIAATTAVILIDFKMTLSNLTVNYMPMFLQ